MIVLKCVNARFYVCGPPPSGNYGNSLDQSLPNASSTTPHLYPVSDGNHHSHLSWTDTKPCVVVNSQWEDNSYRIHFLNILLMISESLASGIAASKNLLVEEGSQEEQVKAKLVETVEHFLDQMK